MTALPATVADLDLDAVAAALARHAGNVTDAAADLKCASSDLRRLPLGLSPACRTRRLETGRGAPSTRRRKTSTKAPRERGQQATRDAASLFVLRNTAASEAPRLDYMPARVRRGREHQHQPSAASDRKSLAV